MLNMDNIRESQTGIELAYLDDLTGIYNRRYLYKYLSEEISKAKKLCLFMLDLDGFKKINDTYGHLEGDALLVSFSETIRQSIGKNGIVMRYAGDEFIVVLPEKEKNEAISIADKLIRDVSGEPLRGKDNRKSHMVTTSLGLSSFPDDASGPEDLIDKADQALYSSKKMGKNRFTTSDQIIQEVAVLNKSMKGLTSAKFVDRVPEFNRLKEILQSLDKEKSRGVLISGAKGIGKSRLLNELVLFSRGRGGVALEMRGTEEGAIRPYGAISDGLLAYLKSIRREEAIGLLDGLEREELFELINLSGDFKAIMPIEIAAGTPDEDKRRLNLFTSLVRIFEAIAKKNLLIVAADDLEMYDLASLSLFNYFLKSKKINILLAGGYFTGSDKTMPFWQFISQPENKSLFEEIELGPLSPGDAREMLASLLGGVSINQDFLEAIYDKTAGNPFFIEETVRLLIDKGLIYFKEEKWNIAEITKNDIPTSFEEAANARFENLDAESKEILLNAAFVGNDLNLDVLKKLSEKNEGEILDIIDKAHKSGLIKSKAALNPDEFNFSNSQLKDALSGLVDALKAKDMHKKIAAYFESSAKGDLGKLAGNALLHYKQAEVQNKVLEYTKKMADFEKRLFSFEEATTYIDKIPEKEVLASVEEILEKPLSDENRKALPDLIICFRSAIESTFLYPPNNQQRLNFQEESFQKIRKILEEEKSLTFSIVDKALLINGEELEKKDLRNTLGAAFAAFLSNYRISSMTLKQGLTKSEFAFFLDSITRTEDYLNKMGGLAKLLQDNNVVFIKIDQVRYEKAHKISTQFKETKQALKSIIMQYPLLSDIISKGGAEYLKTKPKEELKNAMQSLSGAMQNISQGKEGVSEKAEMILDSMKEIAEPVSKADPAQWENLKKELADTFFSLDPALRATVIKKDFFNIDAPGAIINDIITSSKDEDIVDTVCNNLDSKKLPVEDIADMLAVVFANAGRKEKITPVLEEELGKRGVTKETIAKILNRELAVAQAKLSDSIEESVKGVAEEHLTKETSRDLKSVIEALISKGKEDLVETIAFKIIKEMERPDSETKRANIQNLEIILGILLPRGKYPLALKIIQRLAEAMEKEQDLKDYSAFTGVIAKTINTMLLKENYKLAIDLIKILKTPQEKRNVYQQKIINDALENLLSGEIYDAALAAFNRDTEVNEDNILGILIELGGNAVSALMSILEIEDSTKDPFDLFVRRRRVASVLKSIGKDAVERLKYKIADQSPRLVKHMLEVLAFIDDKSVCADLADIAAHPDQMVREELVKSLRKLWCIDAVKVLIRMLKDKNSRIRMRARDTLIEMGDKSIVAELENSLKDKDIQQDIKIIIERINKKDGK